jgi:hypothetical protein
MKQGYHTYLSRRRVECAVCQWAISIEAFRSSASRNTIETEQEEIVSGQTALVLVDDEFLRGRKNIDRLETGRESSRKGGGGGQLKDRENGDRQPESGGGRHRLC